MNKTELLKELRNLTSAGMGDCNKALVACDNDLQKAVDWLKIKGLNVSSGRDNNETKEGVIAVYAGSSNNKIQSTHIVEINCETDFTAKSEAFQKRINGLQTFFNTEELQEDFDVWRKETIFEIKENIVLKRESRFEIGKNELSFDYIHSNKKIGVILLVKFPEGKWYEIYEGKIPTVNQLMNNIAMHIAATNPLAINKDQLLQIEQDRQRLIFEVQVKELNKPEKVANGILQGKINKWYKEVCLLDQECVWLPKTTVGQTLIDLEKETGVKAELIQFVRYEVGG